MCVYVCICVCVCAYTSHKISTRYACKRWVMLVTHKKEKSYNLRVRRFDYVRISIYRWVLTYIQKVNPHK